MRFYLAILLVLLLVGFKCMQNDKVKPVGQNDIWVRDTTQTKWLEKWVNLSDSINNWIDTSTVALRSYIRCGLENDSLRNEIEKLKNKQ